MFAVVDTATGYRRVLLCPFLQFYLLLVAKGPLALPFGSAKVESMTSSPSNFPLLGFNKQPENLITSSFLQIKTKDDLANFLGIKTQFLTYLANNPYYTSFSIPKRDGTSRSIHQPAQNLLIIQKKLNHTLQLLYTPKSCAHAYTKGRSIISNASPHTKKNLIIKFDLKNFFNTINFGRVKGMFESYPLRR